MPVELARELGGALGIAVLGSVLNTTYTHRLHLPGVPANIAEKATSSFAIATHLGQPIATHSRSAFIDGMQTAILGAAASVILAVITVTILLSDPSNSIPHPKNN